MKSSIICLLTVLTVLLFSCSKHDNPPPVVPPSPVDSLFSWQLIDNSTGQSSLSDVWFVSASTGFYIGADNTIYQSADSGRTWIKILNSSTTDFLLNLFFVNAQYGFAQSLSELEITRDGGNTWSEKPLATTQNLSIFFTSPSTGYVGDLNLGLYKTTDTGNTWTQAYIPPGTGDGYYPYFLDAGTGYVFTGNGYFSRSIDSGASWESNVQFNLTTSGPTFCSLQFPDSLTGFFASPNGLLKTVNGGQSWNINYSANGTVNAVKFFDDNTGYYLTDSIISKTVNGGQNWTTSCRLASDRFTGMHFISPTNGWACSGNGRIFRIDQ